MNATCTQFVRMVFGFAPLMMIAACGGQDQAPTEAAAPPPPPPPPALALAPAPVDQSAVQILNASPIAIAANPELSAFVQSTAEAAIAAHCASCHGADLSGGPGIPNLIDSDWLWGSGTDFSAVGAVMSIQRTLLYGIRNHDCPEDQQEYGACAETRYSQMPAYGTTATLTAEQIADVAEYVLSLSGQEADAEAVARAEADWMTCSECHGQYGEGYPEYGGPNLSDDVTLYGNDRDSIRDVIANGREGACPVWGATLDAATIKALAVYIYKKANGE